MARADGGATDWPDQPHLPGPPEPDPLPVDVLPPAIRDHVESVAGATQTPPCMGAMLGLASVSAAIGGRAEVHVDDRGWRELAVIYTSIVAPPAARKSPVYAHHTAPIVAWERDAMERDGPAYRRALDCVEVARAALAHARSQAARGQAGRAEVDEARIELDRAEAALPPLPRILAGDATPEALVRLMAQTGGSIALLAPEADPLGIADGRYSDTARIDELLRCWSGESIRVDRVSREPLSVDRPALTLGICVQPAALDALQHTRVHRGRGLWGRVLWCAPPHGLGSRRTGRDVPTLDIDAAERYARVIRSLLDAAWADGVLIHTLALAPAAIELAYAYEAEIEAGLGDGGRLAGIRDHAGKITGQSIRLAALVELAARAEDGRPLWSAPIGPWAMDGGVRLARALTTHALHVLGAAGIDAELADLIYVMRRIREISMDSAEITVRDLARAVQGRASIADADEPVEYLAVILDQLVRRGCVRLRAVLRDGPGRPASPVIELHPSLRSADSVHSVSPEREVVL